MIRTILRGTMGLLLAGAALAAAPAFATERDDALELAATMRSVGYSDEAWQVEQLAAGMADSELKLLADLGIAQLTAKLKDFLAIKQQVDEAGIFVPPAAGSRTVLSDYDLENFPDALYPPQNDTCLNPVGQVSTAALKVGLKATVFALREAVTAADGIYRAAMPACNIIVIAIGIGGNASTACIIAAVAVGVVDGALAIGENYIDNLIFCDEQVHFAESAAATKRTEFVSHQLELHDLELAEQLGEHDVEVQARLREAIERAKSIEAKVDLGLKTQLEVAMDRKAVKRPAVFYLDRLDELCDLAQEAIDDLPAGYVLATTAQRTVSIGMQLKVTDPKRAADECIRGYSLATTGSSELP